MNKTEIMTKLANAKPSVFVAGLLLAEQNNAAVAAVTAEIERASEGKYSLENAIVQRSPAGIMVQGRYVRRNTSGVLIAAYPISATVELGAGCAVGDVAINWPKF